MRICFWLSCLIETLKFPFLFYFIMLQGMSKTELKKHIAEEIQNIKSLILLKQDLILEKEKDFFLHESESDLVKEWNDKVRSSIKTIKEDIENLKLRKTHFTERLNSLNKKD
ncbi:hypothetical protein [Nitrosopumilus spindle-shaped virus]|uniref:Uncharacterized protein n=1 Tax=Nitrosopumilus spindle-shaped virus TaxID=2508184 RepID=A0A514K347_9VIRU|nr:hypothetical protein [Nitrosopumilus spindle-shaped virus]